MKNKTEARRNLEVKASFIYFVTLIFMSVLAAVFQMIGNVDWAGILRPFLVFSIATILAFIVYVKKKKGEDPQVYMWFIAMITIIAPVYAKFNYVIDGGMTPDAWTFAAESYNSSIVIIVMILILQLLFEKRIIITASILGFAGWIFFIYMAIKNGANYTFTAMREDGTLVHGLILLREYYFIIAGILIAYISYRNIPVLDDYDEQVIDYNKIIEHRKAQLEHVLETVESLSKELAEISASVNEASIDLSKNSSTQAVSIEEIVASMEEMGSSVSSTNQNTKETNKIAKLTSEQAIEGKNVVKQTVDAMTEITENINLIEEIAFQTNILALNAAVEAARAGEQGRGFAVVAGEVRKLAEKSQTAAKAIREVGNRNLTISERVIELFNQMVPNVKQTSDLVTIVAEASAEQDVGIRQVNSGLEQFNTTMQKNSTSAGMLASLSNQLYSQSKKLLEILERAK